jgi:hypothetical protein
MKIYILALLSFEVCAAEKSLPKVPKFMIKAKTPPKKDSITQLNEQTMILERQVQDLASSVQAHKDLIDQRIRSNQSLDLSFKTAKSFQIHQMIIRLDDFQIYDLNDSNFLPESIGSLSIYDGPIAPGTHNIRIQLRASQDKIHFVDTEQNFTIVMPTEPTRKQYSLQPEWKKDGGINVIIIEEPNEP